MEKKGLPKLLGDAVFFSFFHTDERERLNETSEENELLGKWNRSTSQIIS